MKKIKRVAYLAPKGVGGIASFSESVVRNWNIPNIKVRFYRIPRNNLVGWVQYPFTLSSFVANLFFRRISIVHANIASKGSPIRKFPFVAIAKAFGIPTVIQIHSGKLHLDLQRDDANPIWLFLTCKLLSWAQGYLVLTDEQMEFFKFNFALGFKQVIYLPNHVEASQDQPTGAFDSRTVDLVFVGRISNEKGATVLLDALASIEDPRLTVVFVGEYLVGDYPKKLEEGLSNHRIKFTGVVPRHEALTIMRDSKALVLPSYSENFPMVVLEAFAQGASVIASNVGSIPKLVLDGVTGSIFTAGNSQELVNAIFRTFHDPYHLEKMASNGKKLILDSYSMEVYPLKLINSYYEIIGQE